MLVDRIDEEDGVVGRAAHQAPETDGVTLLSSDLELAPGRMVEAKVVASEGVDLVAEVLSVDGAACTEEAGR